MIKSKMTKNKVKRFLFVLFLSFEVTFVINLINIESVSVNTYVTISYESN